MLPADQPISHAAINTTAQRCPAENRREDNSSWLPNSSIRVRQRFGRGTLVRIVPARTMIPRTFDQTPLLLLWMSSVLCQTRFGHKGIHTFAKQRL